MQICQFGNMHERSFFLPDERVADRIIEAFKARGYTSASVAEFKSSPWSSTRPKLIAVYGKFAPEEDEYLLVLATSRGMADEITGAIRFMHPRSSFSGFNEIGAPE